MSSEGRAAGSVVSVEDRSWLPRHCRGDRRAFAELLEAYQAPVYGYLVRCGVPASVRDDLFQQIFVKVHMAAASYDPARPLRPWLFTIVANCVRSHFRDSGREPSLDGGAISAELPASGAGPDGELEAAELAAWLERALPALPLEQREVLLLANIRGLPLQDIARVLDMPVNTVKTHLRRARLRLARELAAATGRPTP